MFTHLSIEPVANNGTSVAKAQVVTYLEMKATIDAYHTLNAIFGWHYEKNYANITPGMLSQNV